MRVCAVDWSYFDKFGEVTEKYMPARGEGDTMASQVVTAVNKLVYKWYNDGDVFDNNYKLVGWCNDLSSYANWLRKYMPVEQILDKIETVENDGDYEMILKELADKMLMKNWLVVLDHRPKEGSIYKCEGPFSFNDNPYDIGDDDIWEDEFDYDDDDEY